MNQMLIRLVVAILCAAPLALAGCDTKAGNQSTPPKTKVPPPGAPEKGPGTEGTSLK